MPIEKLASQYNRNLVRSLAIKHSVTLEEGDFGTYLVTDANGNDVLFQVDMEYPSLAQMFGWDGDSLDIEGAIEFLDDNIGAEAEDPGYFSNKQSKQWVHKKAEEFVPVVIHFDDFLTDMEDGLY